MESGKNVSRPSEAWLKKCKSFQQKRKAVTFQSNTLCTLSVTGLTRKHSVSLHRHDPLSFARLVISNPQLQRFPFEEQHCLESEGETTKD